MDNILAWMSHGTQYDERSFHSSNDDVPEDAHRKKTRIWVFTAQILTKLAANIDPPISLDVDNGLPGIELWFGKSSSTEIGLLCHLHSCAAMNIGNLRVHQWLMTTYPHFLSEYIQYSDSTSFQPLQLSCVVTDVETKESTSNDMGGSIFAASLVRI